MYWNSHFIRSYFSFIRANAKCTLPHHTSLLFPLVSVPPFSTNQNVNSTIYTEKPNINFRFMIFIWTTSHSIIHISFELNEKEPSPTTCIWLTNQKTAICSDLISTQSENREEEGKKINEIINLHILHVNDVCRTKHTIIIQLTVYLIWFFKEHTCSIYLSNFKRHVIKLSFLNLFTYSFPNTLISFHYIFYYRVLKVHPAKCISTECIFSETKIFKMYENSW